MAEPVKVLIADDESNMRKTLIFILSDFDCVITEVETGEDAFVKICKEYFDVAFFDNKLPGDDGIKIIRRVRELNIEIGKIFLITGYPGEDPQLEAKELGVFHFQNKKDMDLKEIREKLNEAMRQ